MLDEYERVIRDLELRRRGQHRDEIEAAREREARIVRDQEFLRTLRVMEILERKGKDGGTT